VGILLAKVSDLSQILVFFTVPVFVFAYSRKGRQTAAEVFATLRDYFGGLGKMFSKSKSNPPRQRRERSYD